MDKKSPDAFRTISEVAEWLGVPTHVLRFWESRFSQVKPVKRAGGRRYYRPADMELLGGIRRLLHEDGMTIRGVQKLLRDKGVKYVASLSPPLDSDEMRNVTPSNVVPLAKEQNDQPDTQRAIDQAGQPTSPQETVTTDPITAPIAAEQQTPDHPEATQTAPAAQGEHAALSDAVPAHGSMPEPNPETQTDTNASQATPVTSADLSASPVITPSAPPEAAPQPDIFTESGNADTTAMPPVQGAQQQDQQSETTPTDTADMSPDPVSDLMSTSLPDTHQNTTDPQPQGAESPPDPAPEATPDSFSAPETDHAAEDPHRFDDAEPVADRADQTPPASQLTAGGAPPHDPENPSLFGAMQTGTPTTHPSGQDHSPAAAPAPPRPDPAPPQADPAPPPAPLADISHIPADPSDDAAQDTPHADLLGQISAARKAAKPTDQAALQALAAQLKTLSARMPRRP